MTFSTKILRNIALSAILSSAVLAVSCNHLEEDQVMHEISLKAVMPYPLSATDTKGVGEISNAYFNGSESVEIGLARIDESEDDSVWPSFTGSDNVSYLSASMTANESSSNTLDIAFDSYQSFLTPTDEIKYASWYPESIVVDEVEKIQKDTENGTLTFPIDGTTDILYGSVATGTQRTGFNTIEFNHALVKYSILVYAMEPEDGTSATADDYWGKLTDIIVSDMPDRFVLGLPKKPGDVDIDDYVEEYSTEFSNSTSDYRLKSLPVTGEWNPFVRPDKFPVGFSNAKVVGRLLAAPPADGHLKIKVTSDPTPDNLTNDDSRESQILTISRQFLPGRHYKIILRFTSHGQINAEVVTADWGESDLELETGVQNRIYYNLSEVETANCYIVASANYDYCFNAEVKGNGANGLPGVEGFLDQYGADYHILSPKKAKIIWIDDAVKNDIELNENVIEGKVLFRLKGNSLNPDDHLLQNEGNALIGVYSDEGMTDLLWTWHIWITDRPHEQGYKNGFSVMDRDLGAVEYDPDQLTKLIDFVGLMYQWGRPTPFPFGRNAKVKDQNGNFTEVSFTSGMSAASAEKSDLANRISNPTVFYTNTIQAGENNKYKPNLWGWKSEVDEYAKTIYDPCPQGYRLPSYKLWRDLMYHDANVVEKKVNGNEISAINFIVDVNNESVYYPITGYYYYDQSDGIQHASVDGESGAFMWAATYNSDAVYDGDDVYGNVTGLPYYLDFSMTGSSLGTLNYYSNLPGSVAMPVRCISRMSKSHVTNLSDYQTANSYIVSKPGYYKFKATVRGNGVGELVSPQAAGSIILTEGNDVDISDDLDKVVRLWWQGDLSNGKQSTAAAPEVPLEILNDGKPDAEGYVTFNVPDWSEGNMILAAKNSRGEILWSWHIWLTDEPQMKKSNVYVVMDRFLGATYAPSDYETFTEINADELVASYGFYYQWGRKDPFPGAGNAADWYSFEDMEWKAGIVSITKESEKKTVANSVLQPTRFHASPNQLNAIEDNGITLNGGNNVASDQCISVMDRAGSRSSLWGYSSAEGQFGLTTTKTMYDPCPPGYCVAYYLLWTDIDGTFKYAYRDNYEGRTVTLNSGSNVNFISSGSDEKAGIVLTMAGFDKTWYPYAGYYEGDDTGFQKIGQQGRFHSATPAGFGSRSLYYTETYSGQAVSDNYVGLPTTYAYPVRCQKE